MTKSLDWYYNYNYIIDISQDPFSERVSHYLHSMKEQEKQTKPGLKVSQLLDGIQFEMYTVVRAPTF